DADGLTNLYEYLCGTDPIASRNRADFTAKLPGQQLTNGEKQKFGLDPRLTDSDGDGISDYDEINGIGTAFRRESNDSFASDPLNPLANVTPALSALQFTGTDGLAVPVQAKQALASWTVMVWVKPDGAAADAALISRRVS